MINSEVRRKKLEVRSKNGQNQNFQDPWIWTIEMIHSFNLLITKFPLPELFFCFYLPILKSSKS